MPSLSLIAVDPARERSGVWITHPLGFQFLIAREGNTEYRNALTRMFSDYRDSKGVEPTVSEALALVREARAAFIVRGWRDVLSIDEPSLPIEYSPDAALAILSDPRLHDLEEWIVEQSRRFEHFRQTRLEATQGNSVAGSSGSSTGVSKSTS